MTTLVLVLFLALCGQVVSGLSVHDVMVNDGSRGDNYFNASNMVDFGTVKDMTKDKHMMEKFTKLTHPDPDTRSDGETADIIKKFFWGKSNGIIMEIGATDGIFLSQSKALEEEVGWHRILVDGAPMNAKGLMDNGKNSFAFSCAICDTTRQVHYIERGGVSGIIEFMSPAFVKRFHPDTLTLEPSQWHTLPLVTKVGCFPLHKILAVTNVYHINVFVVDVEGGELAMLHSINWSAILFDVIIVETDTLYRPPAYNLQVIAFLANKGYHVVYTKGRNTWFKHFAFVPTPMP